MEKTKIVDEINKMNNKICKEDIVIWNLPAWDLNQALLQRRLSLQNSGIFEIITEDNWK